MLTARKRNNLVLIQHVVTTTDPQWGDEAAWQAFAQAWVSIDPQRGREVFVAGENESVVTHTIRGDYQELQSVDAKMRVIFHPLMSYSPIPDDARVFKILAVMPDYEGRGDVVISAAEMGRRYSELASDIPA